MKKKTAYVILLIVSIGFSSFKKECNNVCNETSLKKDSHQKIIPVKKQEWNLAPFYNFLEI